MKKRIILFAFLLLVSKIEVNAQTNEPTIETVTNTCVDPTDYNFNDNTDDQKLEVPFLGWMWNSRAVISAMVLANQAHIYSEDAFTHLYNTPNLTIMSNVFINYDDPLNPIEVKRHLHTEHGNGDGILLARALHFDPSIYIPETITDYYAIAEQCDGTNNSSVFGFKNRDIETEDIDQEYNNVKLLKAKYSDNYTLVLSEPWKLDVLDVGSGIFDPTINSGYEHFNNIQRYNGNKYYLSINLQRMPSEYNEIGSEAILKVEMTFLDQNDEEFKIRWNEIPDNTAQTNIQTDYGWYRPLQQLSNYVTGFYIYKNDLPANGDPITISGYCTFFGGDNTNPRKEDETPLAKKLKKLNNIKIYYKNSCDVQINNVTLDTPHARELFQGMDDDTIKWVVGHSISKFSCGEAVNHNTRYFRELTLIETGPQCWAADRYFAKLIGNVNINLSPAYMPVLYDAYVNTRDRWLYSGKYYERISAPYKRRFTNDLYKEASLGVICGYDEKKIDTGQLPNPHQIITLDDTLNSGYETYFPIQKTRNGLDACTTEVDKINYLNYEDRTDFASSTQFYWDDVMADLYYGKENTGFQYNGKPWYSMDMVASEYLNSASNNDRYYNQAVDLENARNVIRDENHQSLVPLPTRNKLNYFNQYRPMTAEELRLMQYSHIIMGCKGLAYDGALHSIYSTPDSGNDQDSSYRTALVFDNSTFRTANDAYIANQGNYDLESLLLNDAIGGDFFDINSDNYLQKLKSTYYRSGAITETMKNDSANKFLWGHKERSYLGMKSHRWEIYKTHRWFLDNANTLLKLKLQAWYGHGFLKLYNQHPDITNNDTILKAFVNIHNIKTRKLWQPSPFFSECGFKPLNFEDDTSSYYDITLLKEDNVALNDCFYIGLQSRRTDPLIFRTVQTNLLPQLNVRELCFYPDAELDKYSKDGGIDPFDKNAFPNNNNAVYWQDLYRKRLGCREISLGLKIIDNIDLLCMIGFEIEELSYQFPEKNSDDWNDMKYWMKDAYNNTKQRQFYPMRGTNIYGNNIDTVNLKFLPGQGKIYKITPQYIPFNIITRKDTTNTNPLDTCEELRNGLRVGFFKVNTGDANVCKYRVYLWNYSDSCNFNVPIQVNIQSDDSLVITNSDSLNFRFINMKTCYGYQNCWIPNGIVQTDTTYIGYISGFCDTSRVSYTVGMRDCYTTDTLTLRCSTCDCCENVNVNLAPVNTENFCFLRPFMSQTTVLPNSETCFYYGLRVSGGFAPSDNILIPDLSIVYDSLNPQPINFPAYAETLANQFLNIYCYPICVYCLKLTYQNINGDDVCSKEVCITIDNSQAPPEITPPGAISSDCYSIMPSGKRNVPSEEVHAGQKIIVDPNPTTGKANVKLNLENDLVGRLVLYTSTGELIKEIYNGKLSSGTTDYQIDLSSQPSGMYIITIESDGMQYIKKFVKE